MATPLNFRSALGGFHKEDVVHYIEYMTSKHTTLVNQLTEEVQELQGKLAQLAAIPDLSDEVAQLKTALEEATDRQSQLEQENQQLQSQLAAAQAEVQAIRAEQSEKAARELAAMELEAYRRAEQAERNAKARAEQIFQQATGTLAQATTHVDSAAAQFKQIAEQVNGQMALLQQAVDSSKNALLDAATTMYSIRTEDAEA